MAVVKVRRVTVAAVWLGVSLAISVPETGAQEIAELEFLAQPITDILLVLARAAGRTVVPDETVSGTASYYFDDTDFDSALRIFLETYGLYVWQEAGIYYVSRVRATYSEPQGTMTVRATDAPLDTVVDRISRAVGVTVLHDPLPAEPITMHAVEVTPQRALEIAIRRFSEYDLETAEDLFYLRRRRADAPTETERRARADARVRREGNQYSITATRVRLFDVIRDLFERGEREYSMLKRSDHVIERLDFADKSFDELLRLILEQADADFHVENEIYYVVEVSRNDILMKLHNTEVIPLVHISASELPSLFPPGLAAGDVFRINATANTLILSGSHEQIAPIRTFVRSIDRPLSGRSYERFDLTHIDVADAIAAIPARLRSSRPQSVEGTNSFVMLLSPEQRAEVRSYLELVDVAAGGHPINLRYIRTADLLQNLPPSVNVDDIRPTSSPTRLFFTGSSARRERFLRELAFIDRPVPQVRYELLVLQFQQSDSRSWNFDLVSDSSTQGDATAIAGSFTSLLNLSFDVLSTFGTTFALRLDWELSNSSTNVMADTTLNGLSGESISFRNTSTFRYRDQEIDPDTGEQRSTGVTRELTSGLIIDIDGWASGDGMVTMDIAATVSRQGSTSSDDDNPPPTSERVVTTHVRSHSGEPVVISGLVQQETSATARRVPLLSRIPFLGALFRDSRRSEEDTELVIYIVPYIEHPADRAVSVDTAFETLYRTLVAPQ